MYSSNNLIWGEWASQIVQRQLQVHWQCATGRGVIAQHSAMWWAYGHPQVEDLFIRSEQVSPKGKKTYSHVSITAFSQNFQSQGG